MAPSSTAETVTIVHGDGRIVVHLPVAVPILVLLLAGITAQHPGATIIHTGRDDVVVVSLNEEIDR